MDVICISDCPDYYIVTEQVFVVVVKRLFDVFLDGVEREN